MTYQLRRATTDDLEQLMALWKDAQFPALELEKRFTEFQIAEDGQGRVLGAIGIHIAGQNGLVHSETFSDFGLTDVLRPLLWDRLQVVARNHGLFRLWTREDAPFWKKDAGFIEAPEGSLEKLPPIFGEKHHPWLFLQLRDEAGSHEALDKEMAMYREAEHAKRESMFRTARFLYATGLIIAALLFGFLFTWLVKSWMQGR